MRKHKTTACFHQTLSATANHRIYKYWHSTNMTKSIIPADIIEQKIYLLRGEKVMLSPDLARLYQVEPRVLVQAVK